MRLLVAPDDFKGTLSAAEAGAAMATGWRSRRPRDDVDIVAMSDGGPGFLDAVHRARGGRLVEVPVRDPLGRPVTGRLLVADDGCYVETADACGLHLLAAAERDPLAAWTAGVGDLLLAASSHETPRILLGLGGSATNDGGAGLLDAVGLRLLDGTGRRLEGRADALAELRGVEETAPATGRAAWPELVAATDVDTPLLGPLGATRLFAAQKGATEADRERLESLLAHLAAVVGRDVPGAAGREALPGAGAAGGLGYALSVLGARRRSGVDVVAEAVGLAERVAGADLVLTGEGSFDHQTLRGKVVAGVAAIAGAAGVPCWVLAGRVELAPAEWRAGGIAEAGSLEEVAGSPDAARQDPGRHLARLASELAAGVGGGRGDLRL